MLRPRVYVAGPISKGDINANVENGIRVGLELLDLGWAPFIPHASHHMDETAVVGTPRYENWLQTDFSYISTCHALLRLPGESEGADREVAYAESLGIPVFFDINKLPPPTLHDGILFPFEQSYDRTRIPCPQLREVPTGREEIVAVSTPRAKSPTYGHGGSGTPSGSKSTTESPGSIGGGIGSAATESRSKSLTASWQDKADSAASANSPKLSSSEGDSAPCTLITTTKAGVSVDFSVRTATPGLGNSGTIQITLRLPSDISAHPLSVKFYQKLGEMALMHAVKQKDYGRESDPFANVRASGEWGVQPWVGAMIRLNDKVRRLQRYAERGELANESAEDSLIDIPVYGLIAAVLYEEASYSA